MDQINTMLEDIRPVLTATQEIVEGMEDGSRKQIKEMAGEVALSISQQPHAVLPFVNHFLHHTALGFVRPGKLGGFVKGQRISKKPASK